jgi:hypothetical protein
LCIKCGSAAIAVAREEHFRWYPSWTYWLAPLPVPMAFVQAWLTRHARLVLPLCARCGARWSAATTGRALGGTVPLACGLALVALGVARASGPIVAAGAALVLLALAALVLVHVLVVVPRTLRAAHIDARTVTLRGVARPVLAFIRGPSPFGP